MKNATNHIGIVGAAPRVSWKTIILPSYYHSHHQISQPNLIPSAPSSSQQPPSHKYLNCPPFVSTEIILSLHTSHFTGIHFINTHFSLRHAFLKIHFLSKLGIAFLAPATSGFTNLDFISFRFRFQPLTNQILCLNIIEYPPVCTCYGYGLVSGVAVSPPT